MAAFLLLVGLAPGLVFGADLEKLANRLESSDPKVAVEAARQLGTFTGKDRTAAVDLLVETLLLGTKPDVGRAIIQSLGRLGDPRALDALLHACRHRNVAVRSAAVAALASVVNGRNEKKVFRAAVDALRDGSSQVRVAGASVLAALADKRLLSDAQWKEAEETCLTLLLKRKDQLSAKVALRKLGTVRTARFLAVHLGELPKPVVVALYAQFLKRKDFGPDPVRYWVVKVLAGLNVPEALAAVMEYVARTQGVKGRPSVELARRIAEQ